MPVKCCGEGGQEGFLTKRLRWCTVGVPAQMILCGSLSRPSLFSLLAFKKKKRSGGSRHLLSPLHTPFNFASSKLQFIVWLLIKFNLTLPEGE